MILILIGVLCGRLRIFDDAAASRLSDFCMKIVSPCAVIESFFRDYDPSMARTLLLVLVISACVYTASIFIAIPFIRNKWDDYRVLRFAVIFGNCGYMGLPLQQAVLGTDGVFFGAVYMCMFNIFLWTYGVYLMSGKRENISLGRVIRIPAIPAVFIGLLIFVFSLRLPEVITAPVHYMGSLNVPLPMVIIGYHLSKTNIIKSFTEKSYYVVYLLRLIVIPALMILVLKIAGAGSFLMTTCVISTAVPTAAYTTMFADAFGQNKEKSSNLVSVCTILSILTLPVMTAIAQSV